jgi:hypothetical protein
MKLFINYSYCLILLCATGLIQAQPIDRKALVERHTVINKKADPLSSLAVGNGRFLFTADITGLQSFPDFYAKGVPLGTQSEWGWHSFTDTTNYSFDETLKNYSLHGREISYSVQIKEPQRKKNAVDWFRQNPHRLQLGNIGLDITKKDGTLAAISDIQQVNQSLNMWTGELHSVFTVEGVSVDVITYCHQQQDAIAVKILSPLMKTGSLQVRLRLPYPNGEWKDVGNNWANETAHRSTIVTQSNGSAIVQHSLDTTTYYAALQWKGNATFKEKSKHYFVIAPVDVQQFEFTCRFEEDKNNALLPTLEQAMNNSRSGWSKFWKDGAAVDFSGSKDPRAKELERRIILSQYITHAQCGGSLPPQETGLTYNSWFGKPHLEMHWWHAVHFALWNRLDELEKQLDWYKQVADKARRLAARQGYAGVRWQKMTDVAGEESPSSVGAFLIWQQPHFITFAELAFRQHKDEATLNKYKELVFATADFMASYAYYDSSSKKYILGKGVIAAQERFKAEETFNPTYELVYWYWALSTAQQWKERLHLPREKKWDEVMKQLSPLPVQDNKYLFTESATDSYTNPEYRTDHPSVFGALGMLPGTAQLDTSTMRHTFDWIWENWSWKDTWGWDFPLTAMTATRLGLPEKAIDALLMPITTNTYLNSGHNYQDERLTIYLPGNGGLLTAIAMMCAGFDGSNEINPGIPKNGQWKVKWEGLKKFF